MPELYASKRAASSVGAGVRRLIGLRKMNPSETVDSELRFGSDTNNQFASVLDIDESTSEMVPPPRYSQSVPKRDELYRQHHGLFNFLRILGFFPIIPIGSLYFDRRREQRSWTCPKWIKLALAMILSLFFFALNLTLFGFNVYQLKVMSDAYGFLHPDNMATLLTSLKPLHNSFNLMVFVMGRKLHVRFLRFMTVVDSDFFQGFGVHPRWARGQVIIFALAFVSGAIPFCARLFEYILLRQIIGPNWFADLSLVMVPMLSLWQLVPLYYFVYINNILRFWFRHLKERIANDSALLENDSEFYYQHYLQLTKCVAAVGDFMNPFLFFSMAVSVVVMCLTIYFLINADTVISIPENATQIEMIIAHTFPAWAVLQICVSFAYVLWIAVAGIKTNEQARFILTAVLSLNCFDEKTRFNVTRFIARIQSQYSWGVSIWKTLPVERGLLFTLFGLISTYAVLLLKLQQDTTRPGTCPNENL